MGCPNEIEIYLSHIWVGKPKVKCRHGRSHSEVSSLGLGMAAISLSSHDLFVHIRGERGAKLSVSLLVASLIPSWGPHCQDLIY